MCSYYGDEFEKWADVVNPIGNACYHCDEVCIHNPDLDWENEIIEHSSEWPLSDNEEEF